MREKAYFCCSPEDSKLPHSRSSKEVNELSDELEKFVSEFMDFSQLLYFNAVTLKILYFLIIPLISVEVYMCVCSTSIMPFRASVPRGINNSNRITSVQLDI